MPEQTPDPEPVPVAPAPPAAAGRETFNVEALAALVERRAADFPERTEEWRFYVMSLRDVAESSGTLPPSVDALVHEVFEPLVPELTA